MEKTSRISKAARHNTGMSSAPFFSVIIPARNAGGTLGETLERTFFQDFKDMEVLVVINASSDDSAEIAAAYTSKYGNLRVFVTDTPGQGNARNVGLDAANGLYVLFCDADDWYLPGAFSSMKKMLSEHPVDVMAAFMEGYAEEAGGAFLSCDPRILYLAFLDESSFISRAPHSFRQKRLHLLRPWGIAYRRELLDKSRDHRQIRFNVNCPTMEGALFNRDCLRAAETAAVLCEGVYHYSCRSGSHSKRRDISYMRDVCAAIDEFLSFYQKEQGAETEEEKRAYPVMAFHMMTHLLRVTAAADDQECMALLEEYLNRADIRHLLGSLRAGKLDRHAGVDLVLQMVLQAMRRGDARKASEMYKPLVVIRDK